jgi:hypothetical protein
MQTVTRRQLVHIKTENNFFGENIYLKKEAAKEGFGETKRKKELTLEIKNIKKRPFSNTTSVCIQCKSVHMQILQKRRAVQRAGTYYIL